MSSAFDIVQKALATLSRQKNLTPEERALLESVERAVAEWHELNHRNRDVINLRTPPGVLVAVLDTERTLLKGAEVLGASQNGR